MAGPYSDLKPALPTADEAIQAGLGASTDTSTVSTPLVPAPTNPTDPSQSPTGRGFNVGLQQPDWAYRATNQDFGQRETAKYNFDTGLVPVAQGGFGAFAALQNRQAGLSQRQAALDEKVKAFDLYGRMGKAADPYQPAFGKWARAGLDKWVRDVADVRFGGDIQAAYRGIATDPQLNSMWQGESRKAEEIGQANQYYHKEASDLIARDANGEVDLTPQERQLLSTYMNAQDPTGVPVQGTASGDFLPVMRKTEALLSKRKYYDEYMRPLATDALQTITKTGTPRRDPRTGKILLTTEEVKQWEEFKDYGAEDMVRKGLADSKEEALKDLDRLYPTSVETKTTMENPVPPPPSSNSSNTPKVSVGAVETGRSTGNIEEGPPNPQFSPLDTGGPTLRRADVERKPVYEITGGKKVPMGPKNFVDLDGNPITAKPTYIVNDKGTLYAAGELVGKGQTVTYTTMEEDENGDMQEVTKTVDTTKGIAPITIPLKGNEATFAEVFGQDYASGFSGAKQASTKPTPEQFNSQWSKLPKGAKLMGPDGVMYTKQ